MSTEQTLPSRRQLFPLTRKLWAYAQKRWSFSVSLIGLMVLNTGDSLRFLWHRRVTWKDFAQQAAFVGVDSLGVALVLTTFSGMVIALEIAKEMVKQGAGNYVGALVSLAILREMAPIMTAFSVIAMAGSAFTAELSTMKITKQVDALRVLHVNPIRYLVVPRVLGCMIVLPMMTALTAFCGIIGGLVVNTLLASVGVETYLDSVWYQTTWKDVFAMLAKSSVFGYLLAIISTSIGIQTEGGAKEVGFSTTKAVVWSFVAMAVADYVLTYLIYGARW